MKPLSPNPLSMVDGWPVGAVAAATVTADGEVETIGDPGRVFSLASVSKIISTWAILVAVEEGSICLETPVGQPGCTLRHLLAHAGGYGFDDAEPVTAPGRRRIYSNSGFELAASAVERGSGVEFATYLGEAVLQPLGMADAELRGSPAHGVWATIADLVRLVQEITRPTLLSEDTVATATAVQFGDLAGVVPGVGRFDPCPWGLGVEIHGTKHPHWMGISNSPAAFGHFGRSGTMMWVDPVARVSLIALAALDFDAWSADALRLWPQLSDAVVTAARAAGRHSVVRQGGRQEYGGVHGPRPQ